MTRAATVCNAEQSSLLSVCDLEGRIDLSWYRQMFGLRMVLSLLGLCGGWAGARAGEAQTTLIADAHVSSSRPAVNSGTLTNLNVGGGYTSLLQFDLSLLPPGTTASGVTRAILRVYCNRADTPGAVQLQTVSSAWGEYSVTYATLPALGPGIATANVAGPDTFVSFDVTATVQAWIAGTAANNGFALTSAGGAATAVQFDSKENEATGHAATLEILLASGGGTAGPQGPAGPPGVPGTAGAQGPAGPAGPAGPTGLSGPPGGIGAPGAAGPPGPVGAAGKDGAPGVAGPAGPVGPAGAQGPQGANGPAGAAGAPGLVYQGAYQSTTNYALGDVVLFGGASYASLLASNHGNTPGVSPAYWGVLTAQGPQGLQGAKGETGGPGPQGATGSTGPPGERGDTGAQGPAGQAGAQGLTGATGPPGLSGPAGPQGAAGPVGLKFQGAYSSTSNYALADGVLWQGAGYVSLIANNHGNTPDASPAAWSIFAAPGATGVAGATGPSGPQGASGAPGPAGATGAPGPPGLTGPQGQGLAPQGAYSSTTNYSLGDVVQYAGSGYVSLLASNHGQTPDQSPASWALLVAKGDAGAAGVAGPPGVTGPAGANGLNGAAGPVGATGAQGPVGAQGPAGAQGLQGLTGPKGDTGAAGAQGPAGQAGAQGVTGATGAQGVSGPAGAQGVQGPVGLNFRGTYDSQTTYAATDGVTWMGASYVSTAAPNRGDTPDQSPAFWTQFAAAGAAGPAGAPGVAGAAGSPGPAGPAGAAGATGPQGVAGAQGPAGAPGAAGPQGVAGPQGPAGAQGVAGATGAPGAKGDTGAQGPAGQAGAQGITGPQGPAGATGPAGPQGLAGTAGAQGVAGPQGEVGVNFRGGWTAASRYAVADAVTFSGSTYLAQAASQNAEPDSDSQTWALLAQAGSAGPTGAAASVTVGTVTTGTPGSAASVTNTGTATSAVLNFSIPQGATGAAGPQGPAGSGSGGGTTTANGSFAAMYHAVSYATSFYAVNAPTAAANETANVLAWVPRGCTASRLDVYSQQTNALVVTLRTGTPGNMAASALSCSPAANGGSCVATGSVAVAAGQFLDLSISGASGSAAGVWTALECD